MSRASATMRAAAVFAAFQDAIGAGRWVPTNHELAQKLGCSDGAICTAVKALVEAGRIRTAAVRRPGYSGQWRGVEIVHPQPAPAPEPQPARVRQARPMGATRRGTANGAWALITVGAINPPLPPIERIRALNAALPKTVAIPASWGCQWPLGDPGEAGFHFCGEPRRHPDDAYCVTHRAQAHAPNATSDAMRAKWQDPDFRAKTLAAIRKAKARRDEERQHQQGA